MLLICAVVTALAALAALAVLPRRAVDIGRRVPQFANDIQAA